MLGRFHGAIIVAVALLLFGSNSWAGTFDPTFDVPKGQTALFTIGTTDGSTDGTIYGGSCGTGFFTGGHPAQILSPISETILDPALNGLHLDVETAFFKLVKGLFGDRHNIDEGGRFYHSVVKDGGVIKLTGNLDGYTSAIDDHVLEAVADGPGRLDIVISENGVAQPCAHGLCWGLMEVGLNIRDGAIFDWLVDQGAPVVNGAIQGYLTGKFDTVSFFNGKDFRSLAGSLTFYAPSGGHPPGQVPEPASAALLLSGITGAVIRRKKMQAPQE